MEPGPIALNEAQERAVKTWAADDRLWTTQETVEFNLRTFARLVLLSQALDQSRIEMEQLRASRTPTHVYNSNEP